MRVLREKIRDIAAEEWQLLEPDIIALRRAAGALERAQQRFASALDRVNRMVLALTRDPGARLDIEARAFFREVTAPTNDEEIRERIDDLVTE